MTFLSLTTQFTIYLNFFIGKHLTMLLDGLGLNTQGYLVNGLTPLRAAAAGFFFNVMLRKQP